MNAAVRLMIVFGATIGCVSHVIDSPTNLPLSNGNGRAISWWWAPSDPSVMNSTEVKGMIDFVHQHKDIVTTIIMRCDIVTCVRNYSAPRGTCENNNGIGGQVTGDLAPACQAVLPTLVSLGIRAELWLGEDDSLLSARTLFNHSQETATALINVGKKYPHIVGFNLDLECSGGTTQDVLNMQAFLTTVTNALETAPSGPYRFSVDVDCSDSYFQLDASCPMLAKSGVHRLMNMRTYNAGNLASWYHTAFSQALASIPLDKLGIGLGCWIDSRTNNTWNIQPESAAVRICAVMNASIQELDMFLLKQGAVEPALNFPEPFWIPTLQRFMGGGGCDFTPPAKTICPAASIGPNTSWTSADDAGCCESSARRGPGQECNMTCAMKECAAARMIWRPENFTVHPYECCHSNITTLPATSDKLMDHRFRI